MTAQNYGEKGKMPEKLTKAERITEAAVKQLDRFAEFPGKPAGDAMYGELLAAFEGAVEIAGPMSRIGDRMMRVLRYYPKPVDVWEAAEFVAEEIQAEYLAKPFDDDNVRCELCRDTRWVPVDTGDPDRTAVTHCVCWLREFGAAVREAVQ